MKKLLLSVLFLAPVAAIAQPIVNSWILNTTGKKASQYFNNGGMPVTWTFTNMTDSADALRVCYNSDTVWVRSQGLTDNMGKWLNPGGAIAQNYTHRFPRKPVIAATKIISPKTGAIGLLLNGVPIYGLSNAYSWNGTANVAGPQGSGIWNVEVGKSEGFVLDTALGAHPQQQGAYHSHTTPYRLYKNTPATQHSPLIGYAFDGYPVYGPYGYSSPMNASSAVSRIKTGYSLRNITTRTSLPYGIAASQTGPAVNGTYPLGTYCEDYEWLASNGGDLDKYNGRTCVTPEYPAGTYAYFVTVDAAGVAAFPYYIGIEYYGQPDTKNFPANPMAGNGITVPTGGVTCLSAGSTDIESFGADNKALQLYPNPANGQVTILSNGHPYRKVFVYNSTGQAIYTASISGAENHTINLLVAGLYFVRCEDPATGAMATGRIVSK